MRKIHFRLEERIHEGRLSPDQAGESKKRLAAFGDLQACLMEADLVIETVPENLELKKQVLAELDGFLPEGAFVCTNSSSIPCSRMADALSRPERFFNINFSQPEKPSDLLVESMRGRQTSAEALIAGEAFVRSLGMVPIITYKEIMGFSFNRVWRAVKKETLHLVDGGFSDHQDIDRAWIMEFGTPFGPFGLMDIIGLDVVRDIEYQYYAESGDESDRPPKLLDEMIDRGKLGVKSGQGFYSYPDPPYKDPSWLRKTGKYREDISKKLSERKT